MNWRIKNSATRIEYFIFVAVRFFQLLVFHSQYKRHPQRAFVFINKIRDLMLEFDLNVNVNWWMLLIIWKIHWIWFKVWAAISSGQKQVYEKKIVSFFSVCLFLWHVSMIRKWYESIVTRTIYLIVDKKRNRKFISFYERGQFGTLLTPNSFNNKEYDPSINYLISGFVNRSDKNTSHTMRSKHLE